MNNFLKSALLLLVACATSFVQAEEAGDAKAGESKIALCIGCHGIKGYQASFPEVYKVPMISGQSASYIVSALNAYQKGDRKHPTMRSVAAPLTAKDASAATASKATKPVFPRFTKSP